MFSSEVLEFLKNLAIVRIHTLIHGPTPCRYHTGNNIRKYTLKISAFAFRLTPVFQKRPDHSLGLFLFRANQEPPYTSGHSE